MRDEKVQNVFDMLRGSMPKTGFINYPENVFCALLDELDRLSLDVAKLQDAEQVRKGLEEKFWPEHGVEARLEKIEEWMGTVAPMIEKGYKAAGKMEINEVCDPIIAKAKEEAMPFSKEWFDKFRQADGSLKAPISYEIPNTNPAFRGRTCGECAWWMANDPAIYDGDVNYGLCRWAKIVLGTITDTPACPEFVER